ncbi:hypothetical protein Hanom_Chr01g00085961 [Helianthus anomalus]
MFLPHELMVLGIFKCHFRVCFIVTFYSCGNDKLSKMTSNACMNICINRCPNSSIWFTYKCISFYLFFKCKLLK